MVGTWAGGEAVGTSTRGAKRRAMTDGLRRYGCLVVAAALVVAGTLATGLLPPTTGSQVLAGAVIVAGFGLGFVCMGGLERFE